MDSIVVEKLRKEFGGKLAVADISFAIPEGSFATLLGPSGCGKSTTLRLLAGLEQPTGGSISIRGEVVSSPARHVPPSRRKIGFVFQAYALWPHLRIGEQVAYPLEVRGASRATIAERVKTALDLVGLGFAADRYPSELSGGQQQRVALARALVFDPDILLLDEPLSNLDAELRAQMRNELHQLHQRLPVTAVYVTHDQLEALSLSDVVVVMNDGKIVESGNPRQVYDRPQHAFTAAFVGGATLIPGTVSKVAQSQAEIRIGDGMSVLAACQSTLNVGADAHLAIKPEDIEVSYAGQGRPGALPATVASAMYCGSHLLVELNLAGSVVRAHLGKFMDMTAGKDVEVYFPPTATAAFIRA
jgi:iron(III) transport system ATP-binding protein